MRAALPGLIGLVLFVVALEVLRTELHTVTWQELMRDEVSKEQLYAMRISGSRS